MPKSPVTTDFTGELIVLGCGTSVGVPAIGCGCDVCRGGHPKNQRTRCALALGLPQGNLLIDTPPDLRIQLLREDIGVVHAVLYTHEHVDHLYGMDDLRLFQFYLNGPVPIYCTEIVERRIRHVFDYAFTGLEPTHAGSTPQIEFHRFDLEPFTILGTDVVPVHMQHGPRFETRGFRFGNVAYCTDTNEIPPESLSRLEGLDVLILDALRFKPHVSHFSLDEAMAVAETLRPRRTIFTHMSHDLDYETMRRRLPSGFELAYDGMRIALT
ncbi:MAG: MBL fold metallo-hydrolase [Planctomycetales bacterium]|nr:MBL fold metallo-hydrolase [Planctomycetales bacterium]